MESYCCRGWDRFLLPVAYVITTVTQAETAQPRSAVLVACAPQLVKLALLLSLSTSVAWADSKCVGGGAGGSGLEPLAAEAVQAVAVSGHQGYGLLSHHRTVNCCGVSVSSKLAGNV